VTPGLFFHKFLTSAPDPKEKHRIPAKVDSAFLDPYTPRSKIVSC